jgi:hypothetical protein
VCAWLDEWAPEVKRSRVLAGGVLRA